MPRAIRRWPPMLFRLAVVALFATFVVDVSPHLVHHLFDHDDDTACPFAATGERQQVTADSGALEQPGLAAAGTVVALAAGSGKRPARPARPARAPPSLT